MTSVPYRDIRRTQGPKEIPGTIYRLTLQWEEPLDPEHRPSSVLFLLHEARDAGSPELVARGFFKFDGCTHVEMTQHEPAIHTCGGRSGLAGLFQALAVAYDRAVTIMRETDDGRWSVRGERVQDGQT